MNFNNAKKLILVQRNLRVAVKEMVDEAGTVALNHFVRSFANQGFTDEGLNRWQRRDAAGAISKRQRGRERNGSTKITLNKKGRQDTGRAILVKSGLLRRSLRKHRVGIFAIAITSSGKAARYAGVHNYGLEAGRSPHFKMPKRQFVGYSGMLNRKILVKFDRRIKKAFNQ